MDITPKEKKKKSQIASGTPLFISLDKLFGAIAPTVVNMNKDIKITLGYNIINSFSDLIEYYKIAYESNNNKEKLIFLNKEIFIIEKSELLLKILFNNKHIGIKPYSNISMLIGDIKTQIYRWENAIEARANNDL